MSTVMMFVWLSIICNFAAFC